MKEYYTDNYVGNQYQIQFATSVAVVQLSCTHIYTNTV